MSEGAYDRVKLAVTVKDPRDLIISITFLPVLWNSTVIAVMEMILLS